LGSGGQAARRELAVRRWRKRLPGALLAAWHRLTVPARRGSAGLPPPQASLHLC
jgi:hypothetical protein